ncbi:unnamed protein product [Linum tenue]|uniref:Uncharacterized protein n=1 Tax=Linum tenue TaxID=586396 RepID=A0AAV0J837_9ROSI|nr:unnamed protein product [Linum tenue]
MGCSRTRLLSSSQHFKLDQESALVKTLHISK